MNIWTNNKQSGRILLFCDPATFFSFLDFEEIDSESYVFMPNSSGSSYKSNETFSLLVEFLLRILSQKW